jgi:hypothetical protein
VAQDLAFAPRGRLQLASYVQHDVPEIGLQAGVAEPVAGPGELPATELARKGGCAACDVGAGQSSNRIDWIAAIAGAALLAGLIGRRSRR